MMKFDIQIVSEQMCQLTMSVGKPDAGPPARRHQGVHLMLVRLPSGERCCTCRPRSLLLTDAGGTTSWGSTQAVCLALPAWVGPDALQTHATPQASTRIASHLRSLPGCMQHVHSATVSCDAVMPIAPALSMAVLA